MFINKRVFQVISVILILFLDFIWYLNFRALGYPDLCLSIAGVKTYLYNFDTFNKCFAFGFTVIGFLLVLYRVGQTEKQIEVMMQQNLFSNYYKHREEFFKFMETIKSSYYKNDSLLVLYSNLFKKSSSGFYNISDDDIKSINKNVDSIRCLILHNSRVPDSYIDAKH